MYLNYFTHKNKIYLKYIDKNGKKAWHTESRYTPPIFVYNNDQAKNKTGGYSIFGQPLSRLNKSGDSVYETKEMVKEYDSPNFPVFGYSKIANSYIYDKFKDQQPRFDLVNISPIDIETECENGFPDPKLAIEKINIITFYSSTKKKYYTLYLNNSKIDFEDSIENIEYFDFDEEYDMLCAFIDLWSQDYPDILTGWNVTGFDINYIYNRCNKIIGEEKTSKLSPWGIITQRETKDDYNNLSIETTIHGIEIVDYKSLYMKYSKDKRELYTLDFIAKTELKKEKLKHHSKIPGHLLYKKYMKDAVLYNIQDVRLIVDLEEKLKMIYLAMIVAYISFSNFSEIFSNMRCLDNLIYMFLKDKNIYFPWNGDRNHREKFEGGAVKETIPGKFRWVVSFDVTSEYPSIIRGMNVSPETIVNNTKLDATVNKILSRELDRTKALENNYTFTSNGSCFKKDKSGFMGDVVRSLFSKRAAYKKMKVDADKAHDKDKSQEYDIYQNAVKVLLNSLYGIMGNPYFRFYDLRLAEGITMTGQTMVKWVMNDINRALQKVCNDDKDRCIASDTDSVYFCFDDLVKAKFGENYSNEKEKEILEFLYDLSDNKIDRLISKSIENFAIYMNCFEPEAFSMKREIISDVAIFIAKKKYIMSVLDKEGAVYKKGEEIKKTGVEAVKKSTPEICRDEMENVYKVLLFEGRKEYEELMDKFYKTFRNSDVNEIAENMGLKEFDKYKDKDFKLLKGATRQAKAANVFNKLVHDRNLVKNVEIIRAGDKIKLVDMKTPNPLRVDSFAWKNSLPDELFDLKEYIDFDAQFYRTFKKSIEAVAKLCGINEVTSSMEDMF